MPIRNKLRPFTDDSAKISPNEPGAYELLYKDTVVYIGSSGNSIRQRMCAHRKRKKFNKVTSFRCKVVVWSDEAIDLETKLCASFKRKNKGNRPRLQERTPVNRTLFDW